MGGTYDVYKGDFEPCGCMTPMSNGDTCPDAGDYSFTYDYQLPDKSSAWYMNMLDLFGMSIKITADFDFNGDVSTCEMSIKAQKDTGYQMVSTVQFVGGAILLVGVAAIGLKKRRVATIQLQEAEGTQSHFEMMPNDAAVGV
jgi:hypothetical protein